MGKLLHLDKTLQSPLMCTASCNKKDILIHVDFKKKKKKKIVHVNDQRK